jgi:hypothetical protein
MPRAEGREQLYDICDNPSNGLVWVALDFWWGAKQPPPLIHSAAAEQ